MSERTAAALRILDDLRPGLEALPDTSARTQLLEEADALRRAIAAFHQEAIRFRIFAVDRHLRQAGDPADLRERLEDVRKALEAAGFHTRSHAAPS